MVTTLQTATSNASVQASAAELDAILNHAAIAPLADRAFLRITGSDATRWLNGMVTNNIAALQPGEGNYNFLLNAQGRILGDCAIYRSPEPEPVAYLLATDTSQIDTIQTHLDKFIIMDDVELANISDTQQSLLICGLHAPALLRDNNISVEPSHLAKTHWGSEWVTVTRIDSPVVPRYELWSAQNTIEELQTSLSAAGAAIVSPQALEALRIMEGTPLYGIDIRNTDGAHDLPQETAPIGAPHPALHFAKGCYLGQEIVERIRSRGNVHRTFSGFQLTGALPAPGTALTADAKPVGELTSVATVALPSGTVQLALGYIRREALDRKLALEYSGGTAARVALPFALP